MFLLKRLVSLAVALAAITFAIPYLNSSTPVAANVAIRGVYGRDDSADGLSTIKATGFNTVTVSASKTELDKLHAKGMKGLVWLWGYSNSTCTWNASDDKIRQYVTAIAGHPAIAAYQVDDEPNTARTHGCPQVADQVRARTQLLHSLDPSAPTYVVISTWDGVEKYPYQHFVGTTDIMGLDVYPYAITGIHLSMITSAIAEADKDGVTRYWAILQDFDDGYYRLPSAEEVQYEFDRWLPSRMEGYFVYHWGLADLDTRPDHLAVYTAMNALLSGGTALPPPPSSPSPTPTPTPTQSVAPAQDTTPPSAPGNLTAAWAKVRVKLSWTASTDDVGVVAYRIYRDGWLLRTTTKTWTQDKPSPDGPHVYRVVAVDAAGNVSAPVETTLAAVVAAAPSSSTSTSPQKAGR